MKLDYKYLKQILLIMEEEESHEISNRTIIKKLEIDTEDSMNIDKFIGHVKLLNDNGCLTSTNAKFGLQNMMGGRVVILPCNFRMTAQGHEFLDILKNDTVFNKIKDFSIGTAVEVGKNLLIKMMSGN